MGHPEFLLVPVLMLADYFLTVLGAIQKERTYDHYFKTEHYELNPVLRESVAKKRWFNPRHLAMTALTLIWLWLITEYLGLAESFLRGVLGCLVVLFGTLVGRHLSNLLIFRRLNRKSDDIEGEIRMSHQLALSMSLYQYFVVVVPVVLLAIFSPTPFVLGALGGVILVLLVHVRWILSSRQKPAGA